MNIILISAAEWQAASSTPLNAQLTLTDRRFEHLSTVNRPNPGDTLVTGVIGGNMGNGLVVAIDDQQITLDITLTQPPPPPSPISLILALPRPNVLARTVRAATTLGVKDIHLINSYGVDKGYWQSPNLTDAKLDEYLHLGLEQARDTQLPSLTLHRRFKPFAQDILPGLLANQSGWVAHPNPDTAFPQRIDTPHLIAIGPERGFNPFEISLLEAAGMRCGHLGARILKVETALAAILGRSL